MKKDKDEKIDVLENHIYEIDQKVLNILLYDQTSKKNILWCTDNYKNLGVKYGENKQIKIELITGDNGLVIKPRTQKTAAERKIRIKEKAEVFTPSWVCNHQNNLVDEIWFGKKDIFNKEKGNTWIALKRKIPFEDGKTWQEYVLEPRIEITCGEAPYIVSRYDTVTGQIIEPMDRIGILDRKIRVVTENVSGDEWIEWVKKAYQSSYGYEWQGDSLLIARENLLYSFMDYYLLKFKKMPDNDLLEEIATIISWNFWQMDGLKDVIPNSCKKELAFYDLFGEEKKVPCKGCTNHDIFAHNGVYCLIMDWAENKKIRYVDLLKEGI
ncbi:MAG: restriction endonuclease subunit M [Coprobacillus sp.]|nr:restriction endonuclease subunit M [Coprobacillus sp.]